MTGKFLNLTNLTNFWNKLTYCYFEYRIIKVWSKDTLILQASLHGHMDVIIDIAVSHCNRYMASGSKDGTVIIWDLQKCSIIKRLTSCHNAQVNRVLFTMVQCTEKQAIKNLHNLEKVTPVIE